MPTTPRDRDDDLRQLMAEAGQGLRRLGIETGEAVPVPSVAEMRRRRLPGSPAPVAAGYLTLVRRPDGVLDWQVDGGPSRTPGPRASRRSPFDGEVIDQAAFRPIMGSEVAGYLRRLDDGFNDRYGLYDLDGRRVDAIVPKGRVLLLVHGTFSKCEALVAPWRRAGTAGHDFLAALQSAGPDGRPPYDQVLLFEHPTLSVPPWLNALDLARAFQGADVDVDVVCHSRGGLVVRWWLEVLAPALLPRARVVFVGSPLMGTSLASPWRLRAAMRLLTNYVAALRTVAAFASLAVPLMSLVQGVMGLVASATTLAARTPLSDAAVAMVPGLASMARYGPDGDLFLRGNFELEKLSFGARDVPAGYHAITSEFESDAPGWQFWRWFRGDVVAGAAADLLFPGPNDLVVDTASMTGLSPDATWPVAPDRVRAFGPRDGVHHLAYFQQAGTVDFVRRAFGV